jgi:hypothetical protein
LASQHASERFVKMKRCSWGYQQSIFFLGGLAWYIPLEMGNIRKHMEQMVIFMGQMAI